MKKGIINTGPGKSNIDYTVQANLSGTIKVQVNFPPERMIYGEMPGEQLAMIQEKREREVKDYQNGILQKIRDCLNDKDFESVMSPFGDGVLCFTLPPDKDADIAETEINSLISKINGKAKTVNF